MWFLVLAGDLLVGGMCHVYLQFVLRCFRMCW